MPRVGPRRALGTSAPLRVFEATDLRDRLLRSRAVEGVQGLATPIGMGAKGADRLGLIDPAVRPRDDSRGVRHGPTVFGFVTELPSTERNRRAALAEVFRSSLRGRPGVEFYGDETTDSRTDVSSRLHEVRASQIRLRSREILVVDSPVPRVVTGCARATSGAPKERSWRGVREADLLVGASPHRKERLRHLVAPAASRCTLRQLHRTSPHPF
jgi:hypothetical protein